MRQVDEEEGRELVCLPYIKRYKLSENDWHKYKNIPV
jgi:hypothetical protein